MTHALRLFENHIYVCLNMRLAKLKNNLCFDALFDNFPIDTSNSDINRAAIPHPETLPIPLDRSKWGFPHPFLNPPTRPTSCAIGKFACLLKTDLVIKLNKQVGAFLCLAMAHVALLFLRLDSFYLNCALISVILCQGVFDSLF